MPLTELEERLLADRLRDVIKSCATLIDRTRTPEEIQRWVDNNDLSEAVRDAAAICDRPGLSRYAGHLRQAYFVSRPSGEAGVLLRHKELLDAARLLLRSIDGTDAVAKGQRSVGGNGKAVATATKKGEPDGKGKRGRPSDTDAAQDKQVWDAWNSGSHRSKVLLARELGGDWTGMKVVRAIDRHRKRIKRAESASDK